MRNIVKLATTAAAAATLALVAVSATTDATAGPWRGGWHGGWRGGYWHGRGWGWGPRYWGGFYWGHAPWYWGPYWAPAYPPPVYWGPPPPPPPPPPRAEAPPPAPPPPAAPQSKSFIVYFPFDKSILTPEAQAVVEDAARYAQNGHATRIEVIGYTDASGSHGYNDALSRQRAKVMAQALTQLGVAPSIMDVAWKGKRDLAVPTADGVREPLNRRSTIRVDF